MFFNFVYNFFFPFKTIGLLNLNSSSETLNPSYFLGNISFVVLFLAVLLYWFDFSDTQLLSKKLKSFSMIGANLSLTLLLLVRWWQSGHFPLSNLYESLIGLSWSFTTVHLVVNLFLPKIFSNDKSFGREGDKIGIITAPTALLTSVFATFFLPPDMLKATSLVPALKSNWLTMHVTVMVLSYAFLLIGSALSITFCVYKLYQQFLSNQNQNSDYYLLESPKSNLLSSQEERNSGWVVQPSITLQPTPAASTYPLGKSFLKKSGQFLENKNIRGQLKKNSNFLVNKEDHVLEEKTQLDTYIWLNTMSYRILGLGFPLLTIGILSGAVWANEAWGSYWSWDPKETWALITWLVFAIYFHSRYNRSSDTSIVPASIASIGFIVIWICYLGVNLLQTGLHSYGWFGALFSFNIF